MPDDFDVIVIGGGPAGENAAGRCADDVLAAARRGPAAPGRSPAGSTPTRRSPSATT
jgi:flavin-dependent dehydrogenase